MSLKWITSRQELIRKTKDSVIKEKEDEDARMKGQAKRLDYITRALRIEEMPILRNKYQTQVMNFPMPKVNVMECWHQCPVMGNYAKK